MVTSCISETIKLTTLQCFSSKVLGPFIHCLSQRPCLAQS